MLLIFVRGELGWGQRFPLRDYESFIVEERGEDDELHYTQHLQVVSRKSSSSQPAAYLLLLAHLTYFVLRGRSLGIV